MDTSNATNYTNNYLSFLWNDRTEETMGNPTTREMLDDLQRMWNVLTILLLVLVTIKRGIFLVHEVLVHGRVHGWAGVASRLPTVISQEVWLITMQPFLDNIRVIINSLRYLRAEYTDHRN
jgi:hypothetical protein